MPPAPTQQSFAADFAPKAMVLPSAVVIPPAEYLTNIEVTWDAETNAIDGYALYVWDQSGNKVRLVEPDNDVFVQWSTTNAFYAVVTAFVTLPWGYGDWTLHTNNGNSWWTVSYVRESVLSDEVFFMPSNCPPFGGVSTLPLSGTRNFTLNIYGKPGVGYAVYAADVLDGPEDAVLEFTGIDTATNYVEGVATNGQRFFATLATER